MKSKTSVKIIVAVILTIVVITLFIAAAPNIASKIKSQHEEDLVRSLERIHMSAIIVDEIEGGLHNDSDENGRYIELSEMSGHNVYVKEEEGKYSATKDYTSGKILVKYGENLQHPAKVEKDDSDSLANLSELSPEDLFSYDETRGKVVVTGFNENGVNFLESTSVIQIPETYNGRDVVEIADNAFNGRNLMGTVIIPESVRKIGSNSFSNNGAKGASGNINGKPYAGSWIIENDKWIKVSE